VFSFSLAFSLAADPLVIVRRRAELDPGSRMRRALAGPAKSHATISHAGVELLPVPTALRRESVKHPPADHGEARL
jgi:hypothetical protein